VKKVGLFHAGKEMNTLQSHSFFRSKLRVSSTPSPKVNNDAVVEVLLRNIIFRKEIK
jgi:hypothetical protein